MRMIALRAIGSFTVSFMFCLCIFLRSSTSFQATLKLVRAPILVRLCITGHVRTFVLPQAHLSIYNNVYLALRNEQQGTVVNVGMVLVRLDDKISTGARHGARTYVSSSALDEAIQLFQPSTVHLLNRSSCVDYINEWGTDTCVESSAFLQLANIHQCFVEIDDVVFTHYVRVRPDSFLASPVKLHTHPTVETWLKKDAPASDQFFMFTRELFVEWWNASVASLLKNHSVLLQHCCPEYLIFTGVNVSQNSAIEGCLIRTSHQLACWRGADLSDSFAQHVLSKLADYSNRTIDQHAELYALVDMKGKRFTRSLS